VRYYVDPFGCAKNQVDAENMMLHLNNAGWSAAQDAADADIIIVNSCGFIQSAKQESINAVLEWRKRYPGKKILLAGCLAQRYAQELAESLPEADGFFGVDDITRITTAVQTLIGSESEARRESSPALRPLLSLPGSAYIKISEGCDNRCSFCAIPLIRGTQRCRTIADIVDECRGLLARGVKELCVIGQDIGSYRSNGSRLPELLNAIAELPGNFWARLLYIHPDHFPLQILDLMERDRRFLPYFDIPFQHGSAKILAAMNRGGAAQGAVAEEYLALVATIRGRIPAAIIRTTFLAGFPGETDADFAALLDFQQKLRADWLGCFAYSHEEDTPAYTMNRQVPPKIAARRQRKVEERQVPITVQSVDRFIGQTLDVLLEERLNGDNGGSLWLGRLYCHAPEVDGAVIAAGGEDARAGDVVPCTVTARSEFNLEARLT